MSHTQHAKLVFIRGIPGSGKSYLAHQLLQTLGNENIVLLDPDALDLNNPGYKKFSEELTAQDLPKAIHPFRWLRLQAVRAAQDGAIIMWNQPFTDEGVFTRLIDFIRTAAHEKSVELDVYIIELNTPPDIAYERIQERIAAGEHGPSKHTFMDRVENFSSFHEHQNTLQLDGTRDIKELTKDALDFLS